MLVKHEKIRWMNYLLLVLPAVIMNLRNDQFIYEKFAMILFCTL